MNIITGYRGEPHITSSQDRAGNQGSYGTGSYVLDVGNKLAATISSPTQVRIADGAICHQGCLANIDAGTYDAVAINNGAQGVNRIDLIVARYTKDSVTSVESIDLVVIQGSSVSGTPTPPSYRTGNIQNGDSPVDMPLYQVRLTGVTLSSVTAVFGTVKTQAELQADVNTLNGNLNSGVFTLVNAVSASSSLTTIYTNQANGTIAFINGQNEQDCPSALNGIIHMVFSFRRAETYGYQFIFTPNTLYWRGRNGSTTFASWAATPL